MWSFTLGYTGPIDRIPDTDTWEGRMALNAALRRLNAEPAEQAARDADWRTYQRDTDREGWARVAGMTLGEAVENRRLYEQIACACHGGPACCRYGWDQEYALIRAAHIVIKLISERPTA
jgi:hypothetical protein